MVPGWTSYFDHRLRSGRLQFPDCKATHAASLKPIILPGRHGNFKDVMERRAVPIDQQLNRLVERQINDNRDFDTLAKLLIIFIPLLYVRLSYNINNQKIRYKHFFIFSITFK